MEKLTRKEMKTISDKIIKLNKKLFVLSRCLKKFEYSSALQSPCWDNKGRGTNITDKTADSAVKIANLDYEIKHIIIKIEAEKNKLYIFINSIDDSLLRQIVYYRHVCCMIWEDVANEIGGKNTGDGLKKLYSRKFM